MGQMMAGIQTKLKSGSTGIGLIAAKLFVGYVIGLTLALITQRMIGFGDFSFYLVIVASTMTFFKVSKPWGLSGVMVFSLVCVLLGLVIRMYILMAPGA